MLILILIVPVTGASVSAATKAPPADALLEHPPIIVRPVLRWRQEGADLLEFEIVSQTFKGTPWRHLITMAKPVGKSPGRIALVTVSGGELQELDDAAKGHMVTPAPLRRRLAYQAREGKIIAAAIRQVPFQPIFEGKKEDEAIAHTLTQYFTTQDPSWPLLLPMVTSVRQGLTAITSVGQTEWALNLDQFVLSGESKRGWTTWLTAARDKRVKGLVPMVFDMLNIPNQLEHQRASWGAYSEEIGDYSEKGLPALLGTPAGIKLLGLIDPYQHRSAVVQPKLIILATNDPYWPVDAANLYFKDLAGPKYLLYLPNETHEITQNTTVDQNRIILTLAASGSLKLPQVETEILPQKGSNPPVISFKSSVKPQRLELWSTTSPTRDFRKALWKLVKEERPQLELHVPLQAVQNAFSALFIRATYTLSGHSFAITSVMGVSAPLKQSE